MSDLSAPNTLQGLGQLFPTMAASQRLLQARRLLRLTGRTARRTQTPAGERLLHLSPSRRWHSQRLLAAAQQRPCRALRALTSHRRSRGRAAVSLQLRRNEADSRRRMAPREPCVQVRALDLEQRQRRDRLPRWRGPRPRPPCLRCPCDNHLQRTRIAGLLFFSMVLVNYSRMDTTGNPLGLSLLGERLRRSDAVAA